MPTAAEAASPLVTIPAASADGAVEPTATTMSSTVPRTPPLSSGRIIVRSGEHLWLTDTGGNLIAEHQFNDRIDVFGVSDHGCMLVQEGRGELFIVSTDLQSVESFAPFADPWYWSSFGSEPGALAVNADGQTLVFDQASCDSYVVPFDASWRAVRTAGGHWLAAPLGPPQETVLFDPETGDSESTGVTWGAPEMFDLVTNRRVDWDSGELGVPERIGQMIDMGEGMTVVGVMRADIGGIVVVDRAGTIAAELSFPRSSLALLSDRVIVVDEGLGEARHSVIDLRTLDNVGDSIGDAGMSPRRQYGDLLVTGGRDTTVLNIQTGAETVLDDGLIRQLSPDGDWLLIQDNGVLLAPVDAPNAGIRLGDGLPVAWLAQDDFTSNE